MKEKIWYKSKEIWVFLIAFILLISKAVGVEILQEGIIEDASNLYITITPLLMAIIRLFWTKDKLIF